MVFEVTYRVILTLDESFSVITSHPFLHERGFLWRIPLQIASREFIVLGQMVITLLGTTGLRVHLRDL